jgi:hypothetical protein
MNRRAYFLLSFLLLIAAFSYWLRDRAVPPPEVEIPELFSAAPRDAASLFYLDLVELRRSPLVAQLLALVPAPREDPEYRDFVNATGFDYSRDLDRIIVALRSPGPDASVTAVAEGRFNQEKISAYALRFGRSAKQHGWEVYVVPAGRSGQTVSFAFTASNRIVLTNSSVLAVEPSRQSPGGLPLDQRELLLRAAGAAIIAVAKIDSAQENFSFFGFRSRELAKLLRNFRSITLAARPDRKLLKVSVEGVCAAPADAHKVGQDMEGLRLLGRVLLADPQTSRRLSPQFLALAEWIVREGEILVTDNRVQLRFEVTPAAFAMPLAPP